MHVFLCLKWIFLWQAKFKASLQSLSSSSAQSMFYIKCGCDWWWSQKTSWPKGIFSKELLVVVLEIPKTKRRSKQGDKNINFWSTRRCGKPILHPSNLGWQWQCHLKSYPMAPLVLVVVCREGGLLEFCP